MTSKPKGLSGFIKESTELEGSNGSGRGKKLPGRKWGDLIKYSICVYEVLKQ